MPAHPALVERHLKPVEVTALPHAGVKHQRVGRQFTAVAGIGDKKDPQQAALHVEGRGGVGRVGLTVGK